MFNDYIAGLARWRGKVALVTGASAGIGMAIAKALAGEGLRVAGTGRRHERLEALRAEIEAAGGRFLPIAADLQDPGAVDRIFAAVRGEWSGVDVLVNNAGLGRRLTLEAGDPAFWQQMLEVNVRAAALCIRQALRDMKDHEDAAVINISSIAGHRVPPTLGASFYSATKHALKALTEGLRHEQAALGRRIKIGSISPGLVVSEFQDVAFQERDALRRFDFRPLDAEDIANTVLFMLAVPRHVQISDVVMRSVESRV